MKPTLTKAQAKRIAQAMVLEAIDRVAYHIDESLPEPDRQQIVDALDSIYASILKKQAISLNSKGK